MNSLRISYNLFWPYSFFFLQLLPYPFSPAYPSTAFWVPPPPNQIQFLLPNYSCELGLSCRVIDLSVVKSSKNIQLPSPTSSQMSVAPQLVMGFYAYSHPGWNFLWLDLSHVLRTLSCCGFICVSSLLYLKNTVFLKSSNASNSYNPPTSSFARRSVVHISQLVLRTPQSFFLCMLTNRRSLC